MSDSEDSHTGGIAHLRVTRSVAEGSGGLLGDALALWSFEIMVLTQSLAAWICLGLALLLVETPRQGRRQNQKNAWLPGDLYARAEG